MVLINVFDTDMCFWEIYPELKLATEFKQLYKSDKSRGKEVSSKKMWFVVLSNSMNSRFINVPEEERYRLLGDELMGNEEYYWANKDWLDPIILQLKTLAETPSYRHLRQWIKTLEDRTKFLEGVEYDLTNFKALDEMAANTAKLLDTFKKVQEMILKEEAGSGVVKGGGQVSLADSGEI